MTKLMVLVASLSLTAASFAQKSDPGSAQKPGGPIVEQPWLYVAKNPEPAMTFQVSPSANVFMKEGDSVYYDITAGDEDTFSGSRTVNGTTECKDEIFRDNSLVNVNVGYNDDPQNYNYAFFDGSVVAVSPNTAPSGDGIQRIKLTARTLPEGAFGYNAVIKFEAYDSVSDIRLRDTQVRLRRYITIEKAP